ncbi:succinyl-diaminopimelate desuccinylase [Grosmannia clavigera kw1407]|uniref:Succinyl-diaminopimelate desuccinylase n=1 Tax=Grosmannia clavigera (strain kw1407 / UAMH 11150) TaxID=655863 RepID=F0XB78_GROCL|nr:succinyl-diaminopimelate desuccinylase [Grosmannia clavigera kw1407]EFX05001.1 succinyl-diaminopimelate desuccinylase [Grosmannia clavigera kw1407]
MDAHFVSARIAELRADLVGAAQALVRAASPDSLDTAAVAGIAEALIQQQIPHVRISRYSPLPGLVNVVATVSSGRPGRRLVFNGHLDTYPLCAELPWTLDPLSGALTADNRIHGRGVCDMKGGIAACLVAVRVLAENRDRWAGDLSITLAGDEETMGTHGSQWLLDNVPEARGDAMVCPDVGSPDVVRFGEKGLCWFEIAAAGTAAHGAHVHKGVNAVDRLRQALDAIKGLETMPIRPAPAEIDRAIEDARPISEALSGLGESETLRRVTVNIGLISGGTLRNLVPASAHAEGDIRLPIGVTVADVRSYIEKHVASIEGISVKIVRAYEPSYTPPSHELVQTAIQASISVLNRPVVANMRVGASDTRLYRPAGVPSVVVGLTPNGMGAENEYVEVGELEQLSQILALIAYKFLTEK